MQHQERMQVLLFTLSVILLHMSETDQCSRLYAITNRPSLLFATVNAEQSISKGSKRIGSGRQFRQFNCETLVIYRYSSTGFELNRPGFHNWLARETSTTDQAICFLYFGVLAWESVTAACGGDLPRFGLPNHTT